MGGVVSFRCRLHGMPIVVCTGIIKRTRVSTSALRTNGAVISAALMGSSGHPASTVFIFQRRRAWECRRLRYRTPVVQPGLNAQLFTLACTTPVFPRMPVQTTSKNDTRKTSFRVADCSASFPPVHGKSSPTLRCFSRLRHHLQRPTQRRTLTHNTTRYTELLTHPGVAISSETVAIR